MERKSGFLTWLNRSKAALGVGVAAGLAGLGIGMTVETLATRGETVELVEAAHKAHHHHEAPTEVHPKVVATADNSVRELECQKLIRRQMGDGTVITMIDDTWYIEQQLRIIDYSATAPGAGQQATEYMCRIDLRSGSVELRRTVGG